MTLKELQIQEQDLLNQLEKNRYEQELLRSSDFLERTGLKIGDLVCFEAQRKRKPIIVKGRLHCVASGEPTININKISGEPSRVYRRLYGSQLETLKKVR